MSKTPPDRPAPRRIPDWLIGLGIALVLLVVVLLVLRTLGAGDDPRFVDPDARSGTGRPPAVALEIAGGPGR